MNELADLKMKKWPFLLCYGLTIGVAGVIYFSHLGAALNISEALLILISVALGSLLAVTPYLLEYRAAIKMVETGALVATLSQIQNIETVAAQIGGATAQWQGVQEHSTRTTTIAKEIADRISAEAAAFTGFLQKANDGEKAALRLEIEKLRRAEGDWLQVTVRMLDHTYALHQAAMRSGQPGLIEQLGNFQNSCRDAARRLGLTPFAPAANDPFDPRCHESPDSKTAAADARVRDTVATGYTFQGKLIRPALVSLHSPAADNLEETSSPARLTEATGETVGAQSELPEQTLL